MYIWFGYFRDSIHNVTFNRIAFINFVINNLYRITIRQLTTLTYCLSGFYKYSFYENFRDTTCNINCYQHTSGGADCRCCYLHFVWKSYKCQQPGKKFFTVLCVRRSCNSIWPQRARYKMVYLQMFFTHTLFTCQGTDSFLKRSQTFQIRSTTKPDVMSRVSHHGDSQLSFNVYHYYYYVIISWLVLYF